jgi:hypothetical protein
MVSSEVQRTLVKSPPELWAELSDPAALARHLGELGEIRIVRAEPESTIEWEAEDLTGTVSIKPSGWGTKVTLTVTRDEPQAPPEPKPEPADPIAEATGPDSSAEVTADAEPEASPEPAASATTEPEASPEPAVSPPQPPEPTDSTTPEEPKLSLFARLFGRRRRHRPTAQEPAHEMLEPAPGDEPGPAAQAAPQPAPSGAPHASVTAAESNVAAASDISAELKAAEEIAAGEVTAVLTAVLDRLGAAHHRPFSRA